MLKMLRPQDPVLPSLNRVDQCSFPRRLGPFGTEGRERSPRTLPARAGGMQAPPVVSAVWAFSAHVGRGHILAGLCVLTPATGQE